MIPETLDEWTLDKIREIADLGVIENDRFDLKADLQPAEHQRKTVAAFANSEGGFLLFGITNDRRVEGVLNAELARDFGTRLRDGLSPSVEFRFADHAHTLPSGRLVYTVHVPRSVRGPHAVYINGAWTFLKRTPGGSNDPMTYEEIRLAFQDTENRRTKLALLSSELAHIASIAMRVTEVLPEDPRSSEQSSKLVEDVAWTTRYPTVVVDTILGDAMALIARKADLWTALSKVRDCVRRSNAIAETYSEYSFIRSTADPQQRVKLYTTMRELARSIADDAHVAIKIVNETLGGTA